MSFIAIQFAAILTQLRRAVSAFAGQQNRAQPVTWLGDRAFTPVIPPNQRPRLPIETWILLDTRLARLAARFQALFARWRAGTLPKPCPSRAGRPARAQSAPRLPSERGWINGRIADAAPCAGLLGYLLYDPGLPDFVAAAPQAGRILRPLCRMLAIDPPPYLRLPPRPARQRPARPAQPKQPRPPRARPHRGGLPYLFSRSRPPRKPGTDPPQ